MLITSPQEPEVQLVHEQYNAWRLIKEFWRSEQRYFAFLFLGVITSMTVVLVGFDVAFTYWHNYFYDALQAYDRAFAYRLMLIFCGLAFFYIVIAVYRYYITQLLSVRWRRWLTQQIILRWLQNRSYYYLEIFDQKTDNPDQRIQEDVLALISSSLDLSMGLISAVTTFFSFIYVLWQLSGDFMIPLGSYKLHIPGYLVWVNLLYAALGTFFTFKIGRPLVGLTFEQQRREATFRFAAIDLRAHAENVALYRGENHQRNILQRLFDSVVENWIFIILRQKLLLWFTAGYNQLAILVPLLVALPNYFNKVFLLGGLIQSMSAFRSVQDSLSYIVNSYTNIAQWQAVTKRLTTFLNHLTDIENKAQAADHLIIKKHLTPSIVIKNLSITTPQNKSLLKNVSVELEQGHHYLIKGKSGLGKSTFVRTIAGIWPYASGEMIYPEGKSLMYLPQKPYMPLGTLAEALLFPGKLTEQSDKLLPDLLRTCGLESFIPKLHETARWSDHLSPGEQQRIAFARVLLQQPDWVFLDESTSMLDMESEKQMYALLKHELPHCSLVSIGHRNTLEALHDQVIDLGVYG